VVRYEDLVARPREVVSDLTDHLGIDHHSATWISDSTIVPTGANHIFAGNPDRVAHGGIHIRADDEWRSRMSTTQKWIVTAITFPILWQFEYLGQRQQR
jgi:hypothetical protein